MSEKFRAIFRVGRCDISKIMQRKLAKSFEIWNKRTPASLNFRISELSFFPNFDLGLSPLVFLVGFSGEYVASGI